MASPPKRTGRDKHRFTGSYLENKYIRMNVNIARLRRNVKKINVKEKNAILGFVKRVGISTIKIHKKEHEKYSHNYWCTYCSRRAFYKTKSPSRTGR